MYPFASKDPRGGHNRASINSLFFQTWSPSMAYILGFIFADGAIEDVQKSSRTCYLSITSKDLEILEQIKNVMDSKHTIYSILPVELVFPGNRKYITSKKYVFRIGSKQIYNDLLSLGVTPRKSSSICFPKIPLDLLAFFIRGYFDGDGCVYLKKSKPWIIFTSGSYKFLEGLSNKLQNFLSINPGKLYTQIQKSGNPCYRLVYNFTLSQTLLKFMYANLDQSPYLKRKHQIYQQFLVRMGV